MISNWWFKNLVCFLFLYLTSMQPFHNTNKIITLVAFPLHFQKILSQFGTIEQPEVKCYKIALHFIATYFPLLRRFKCLRICWKENPQSFNSLNNSKISFSIRQLCEYWQPCPSSPLEINLFPAVLALHGKSDSSAFTNGSSHQQNVNYKSKTVYHVERGKQFSRQRKLCLLCLFSSLYFLLNL